MTTVSIAAELRGNDPTTIAVTPAVSGVKIRGANVVTEAGVPLALTKQAGRSLRWRKTTADVRALSAAGTLVSTANVPTITSVLPATADNDSTTVVTITGTGFEVGASVKIGETTADDVVRVSATSITFTVPTSVVAGTYDITVTDSHLNVTSADALEVTEAP